MENGFGLFDTAACGILSLCHDTHADHIVVQWDVPKPAFLGAHGNGCLSFIDVRIAFGTLVVGPHGNLVQIRVPCAPAFPHGGETLLAGAVERDRCTELEWRTIA